MNREAQKKALLLHTAGIEVQELYERLTNPGPTEEFEEDTATEKVGDDFRW